MSNLSLMQMLPPRRPNWTTIAWYAPRRVIQGFKHAEASAQFDLRYANDRAKIAALKARKE